MDDPLPPPDSIPPDVWNTWSLAARVLIATLVQQVAALTTRVQELEQRLAQTSQNSSKPPSSDPPSAPPRPAKTPRGLPRGGQPDHPGATRERRKPDTIVPLHPTACPQCATTLAPTLPDAAPPQTTQVWELPPITPIVTDYVQHTVCCPTCAARVTAALPPEARTGYGSRVTALVGHLHGTYHLSDRAIGDLLADVADLPIGLGSVVTSTQRVSQALSPLDAAIHTAVHTAVVVHIDETSWREAGQRRWLWAPTTDQVTSIRITTSRGRVGLDALLPATFDGIVESDRWNAYNRYPAAHRQLCWAHLTRNIRARAESGMRDSPWARDRLAHVESMFTAWHAFRDGATTRAGLQTAMQPIQQAIRTTVEDGRTRTWDNVTDLSQEVLTWWDAL